MVCGHCSKEQQFSADKPCVACGASMTKSRAVHWQVCALAIECGGGLMGGGQVLKCAARLWSISISHVGKWRLLSISISQVGMEVKYLNGSERACRAHCDKRIQWEILPEMLAKPGIKLTGGLCLVCNILLVFFIYTPFLIGYSSPQRNGRFWAQPHLLGGPARWVVGRDLPRNYCDCIA